MDAAHILTQCPPSRNPCDSIHCPLLIPAIPAAVFAPVMGPAAAGSMADLAGEEGQSRWWWQIGQFWWQTEYTRHAEALWHQLVLPVEG